MVGLRSLWLDSRLKPWLKSTRGLRQLMAASHGLQHHGDLVYKLQTSFIVAFSKLQRNFVAAYGLACSTAAYGGLRRRLRGLLGTRMI